MVSNILNNISSDIKFAYPLICGLIGSGPAIEFRSWLKIYKDLPSIENIFLGKEKRVPKDTDRLYALVNSMIAYARDCNDFKLIANSIEYANNIPADFGCVLIRGYQSISEEFAKNLMKLPTYLKWLNTRGKLLNGIIH
jgi:hypothetical protein